MKKLTAILLSALLILSLAACGNSNQNTVEDTQVETDIEIPSAQPDDNSTEIAEDNAEGDTEGEDPAADITESGSGNILIAYFSVIPTTHDPLLEFAYNEKADDARRSCDF